jgi:hypothetical protein
MAEDADARPGPAEQVSRLYEDLEAQAANASEELVGSSGFAALLARAAENTAALTKLSGDAMDLILRNLRFAGRRDVVGLARQLARTEDKLERVLQEVEELRDELGRDDKPANSARDGRAARNSNSNTKPARAARAPARRRPKDSS